MKLTPVVMVRVYLMEQQHLLQQCLDHLHDEAKVKGVTVFRGISGYGESGKFHLSHLLDLSVNLPITIEFFDTAQTVDKVLEFLNTVIKPGHIVTWPANANAM